MARPPGFFLYLAVSASLRRTGFEMQDPLEVHTGAFRDTCRRILETLCQCERCLSGTRHEHLHLTSPESVESVLADDPVTRRQPIREHLRDEGRRNSLFQSLSLLRSRSPSP